MYTVSEFIIAITSQSNSKFIATYWYAAPLQAPSHDQVSCCALRARTWCACPASHPSPDPISRGFGVIASDKHAATESGRPYSRP